MARKILLADDSVTAQNMGRKILADAGYEVITVNNGSAALKKISEVRPDLIVLDVYMPGYSGLEVCQRLKETADTARIPILLTVGKLEPFKPEEAKRVRAEGFIVKPFEASELLAALTKLEDKMVPRAESSKPGRFARANAALEEGRYDKTVAVEEDTGWKNRISFPSKKNKAVEEEDGQDAANHTPAKKDLRAVAEPKPPHPPQEVAIQAPANEVQEEVRRVDLGALVPEGLPKDVTAEEIAALAAAAAQMKGKSASEAEASPSANAAAQETPEAKSSAEPRKESKAEPIATFAAHKPQEPVEVHHETPAVAANETPGILPSLADIVNASRASEPEAVKAAEANAKPATMAAAAGAEYFTAPPRWTAVAVAVAPDEAAISLENEMQQAQTAIAAATAQAPAAGAPSDLPSVAESSAALQSPSPVEPIAPELAGPVSANSVLETAEAGKDLASSSAVAASAAELITSAVKEFQRVAATPAEPQPPAPAESEPASAQVAESSSVSKSEPQPLEIAEARLPVEQKAVEPEPAKSEPHTVEPPQNEAPEPKSLSAEQGSAEQGEELKEFAVAQEAPAVSVQSFETAVPASAEVAPEKPAEDLVSDGSNMERDHGDVANAGIAPRDSEIAHTTAAAWATWRRIRESGEPQPDQASTPKNDSELQAPDAALAVAAGAEKAPEDAPASLEESGDIANIVDSVLADLRPKIVEEISRKLGKKK